MLNSQPALSRPTPAVALVLSAGVAGNWYAVYTRSRHEKIVSFLLSQKGINTFLPLLTKTHRWSDRNKAVQVPLFPGYTFVHIPPTPHVHLEVLRTTGVVGFVGNRNVGVAIPDKQIEHIQTILTHRIPCGIYPLLRAGQRVRIRGGCLDGVEGCVVSLKGHRSLVISVESVQHSLAIRLEGYDVDILSASGSVA